MIPPVTKLLIKIEQLGMGFSRGKERVRKTSGTLHEITHT